MGGGTTVQSEELFKYLEYLDNDFHSVVSEYELTKTHPIYTMAIFDGSDRPIDLII